MVSDEFQSEGTGLTRGELPVQLHSRALSWQTMPSGREFGANPSSR